MPLYGKPEGAGKTDVGFPGGPSEGFGMENRHFRKAGPGQKGMRFLGFFLTCGFAYLTLAGTAKTK